MTRRLNPRGNSRTSSENHSSSSGIGSNPSDPNLTPLQKALLEEANRKMRVRIDGKDQEISAVEAVLKKQVQSALSGSTHAQGQLLRSLQEAQEIKDRKIAEEVAHGHEMKRKAENHLKLREAKGLDIKYMLFHPDDIIVTVGVGYEIKGPVTQDDLETIKNNCAHRDLMFSQAVLEERPGPVKKGVTSKNSTELGPAVSKNQHDGNQADNEQANGDQHSIDNDDDAIWDALEREELQSSEAIRQLPEASSLAMAFWHQNMVPERFHLDNAQIDALQRPLRRLKTRELLKEMRRLWQQNGDPRPRGFRMPTLERVEKVFKVITSLWKDMNANNDVGTPMTEREICKRLMKLNE